MINRDFFLRRSTRMQSLFDTVMRGFHAQGWKQSYDGSFGGCKYRMEEDEGDKRACAFGILMPDDVYSSRLEGSTVITMACNEVQGLPDEAKEKLNAWLSAFDEHDFVFLHALQRVHDAVHADGASLRSAMEAFGKAHGIDVHSWEY
jgi:hypothetical protein